MYSKVISLFPTLVWSRNQVQRVNSQPICSTDTPKVWDEVRHFFEMGKIFCEAGKSEVFDFANDKEIFDFNAKSSYSGFLV